jgi:hypothetical protein
MGSYRYLPSWLMTLFHSSYDLLENATSSWKTEHPSIVLGNGTWITYEWVLSGEAQYLLLLSYSDTQYDIIPLQIESWTRLDLDSCLEALEMVNYR